MRSIGRQPPENRYRSGASGPTFTRPRLQHLRGSLDRRWKGVPVHRDGGASIAQKKGIVKDFLTGIDSKVNDGYNKGRKDATFQELAISARSKSPPVAGTTGGNALSDQEAQRKRCEEQPDDGEYDHEDLIILHTHHLPAFCRAKKSKCLSFPSCPVNGSSALTVFIYHASTGLATSQDSSCSSSEDEISCFPAMVLMAWAMKRFMLMPWALAAS